MKSQNFQEMLAFRLSLPDPQQLTLSQLQELFVDVSKRFAARLENCKEVEELQDLQIYMRAITSEIERKQKDQKK